MYVKDNRILFYIVDKQNCHICDEILEGLEKIDDECDVFGIHLVKIQDPQLAKRYSIKTFPALVYFRNGNPLLFEGIPCLSMPQDCVSQTGPIAKYYSNAGDISV